MKMLIFALVLSSIALIEASPTNFIVNGAVIPAGSANWHAHINVRETAQALETRVGSGALISTRHVLTAASNTFQQGWWNVGLGSESRLQLHWYSSDVAITHEEFNPKTLNNNLAIIVLPVEVALSPSLNPATLPGRNEIDNPVANEHGMVSGFGFTTNEGNFAELLMGGFQRVISNYDCVTSFPHTQSFSDNIFCTLEINGNVCAGDQGTAFTMSIFFNNVVYGIASFANAQCDGPLPTVFTRVTRYRDWIDNVMEQH